MLRLFLVGPRPYADGYWIMRFRDYGVGVGDDEDIMVVKSVGKEIAFCGNDMEMEVEDGPLPDHRDFRWSSAEYVKMVDLSAVERSE